MIVRLMITLLAALSLVAVEPAAYAKDKGSKGNSKKESSNKRGDSSRKESSKSRSSDKSRSKGDTRVSYKNLGHGNASLSARSGADHVRPVAVNPKPRNRDGGNDRVYRNRDGDHVYVYKDKDKNKYKDRDHHHHDNDKYYYTNRYYYNNRPYYYYDDDYYYTRPSTFLGFTFPIVTQPTYYAEPQYYDNRVSVEYQVQQELARRGFYRGPIDGAIGPASRRAIADYQYSEGLAPTGRIDQALLESLGIY